MNEFCPRCEKLVTNCECSFRDGKLPKNPVDHGCYQTTSPEELRKHFMDVCTPHSEEHRWAIREIERLQQELAQARGNKESIEREWGQDSACFDRALADVYSVRLSLSEANRIEWARLLTNAEFEITKVKEFCAAVYKTSAIAMNQASKRAESLTSQATELSAKVAAVEVEAYERAAQITEAHSTCYTDERVKDALGALAKAIRAARPEGK